ncbi:MAG: hypothetical protein WA941_18410 [Nitrososphaeraceae archaeon]
MHPGHYQIENRAYTKLAITSVVIAVLFLPGLSTTSLATEEEDDCFNTGYRDGRDHPFDHEKNEECKGAASSYYHGFINGCMSVEGNLQSLCRYILLFVQLHREVGEHGHS